MIRFVCGPRMALIVAIVLTTVACDQATKHVAKTTLRHHYSDVDVVGKLFYLRYAENTGGFLSLGATLPTTARFWLLTVFTSLILAGIAYVLFTNRELARLDAVALALLLSGGIGNLIDRALRGGNVVDFMVMSAGSLHTGVFNVADVAVMTGIFLLFANKLRTPPARQGDSDGTQES